MYCYVQINLMLLYNIQAQSKLQISLIKPRVSRLNYECVRANIILHVLIKRWMRRHYFNERWQNEISLEIITAICINRQMGIPYQLLLMNWICEN